ncbi:MarR family transcriptional regulator [Fodinicurvata sp. EGI_FJ10296]|jgi:DNA-binding MarR family transcriptional regulator|uniref:MarR family winged helix-turn-helix transcriptional regulator n=1 Tax=Fodinicurvata sp. EGI_FJ10296 TaxID=3231908 RepID=UPI0034519583
MLNAEVIDRKTDAAMSMQAEDELEVESSTVEEPDGIAQLLRDAQRAMSRTLALRLSSHQVSIGHWYFLRALWEEDGLTQRELSHRVGMMEPTTVTALNGMERRGLVQRVRNPRDRRKVNIFLSDKGRSLKDQLLTFEADVNAKAVDGLNADQVEALVRALKIVNGNLSTAAAR